MRHCPDLNQRSPVSQKVALTAKPQHHVSSQTMDGNHFDKKPGKHNYKQKYDVKMRRCPVLNHGSPVYYAGALTVKPPRHVKKQTMGENHFEKKHGKHNDKPKYDWVKIHCPDMNQLSPVYQKCALTAKPQRKVSSQTIDEIHFDKSTW